MRHGQELTRLGTPIAIAVVGHCDISALKFSAETGNLKAK